MNNSSGEREKQKLLQYIEGSSGIEKQRLIELYAYLEGYISPPVDIITFIEDEYYLGKLLKGRIYPIWRNALKKIFPNPFYSPYVEVVFTGAIGLGKTTIARIGLMYDLYKLLLLRDPHKKFNLIKSDMIVIALFNATLDLAEDVLYEPFKNLISSSDFFQSMLDIDPRRKTKEIKFKNNIGIVVGSRFSHALGMAVFGGLLDEANFSDKVKDQVYNSYTAILRRMQSRFFQRGGKVPGHLYLVSSKKSASDFLEIHIENSKGKKGFVVFDYPVWEVKKHMGLYSGKTFKVFIGDDSMDPFIIDENTKLPSNIDSSRIINIPIEYRDDFEKDIYNSLRDIAGVSVGSTFRLFKSKEVIIKQAVVTNPVNQEIIRLDFYNPEDTILDKMNIDYLRNPIDKHIPRFVHIDLALTKDRVGIAATYVKEYREVVRRNPVTMEMIKYREPVTITEFVIYIEALPSQEIPFYKIRDFIISLVKIGYPVAKVTLDGYQSIDMKQQLNVQYGIDTEIISVDKTKDPYLSFKSAILEGRAYIPNHPLLIKELIHLEERDKKVDHPEKFPDNTRGSKDGADAVVGSYWASINSRGTQINRFVYEDWDSEQQSPIDIFKQYGEVVEDWDVGNWYY